MLCLYWKNTQTTLLMWAGNAFSSQYSLCGWVHHYQGETLVRKIKPTKTSTALKVHPLVCIAYEGQVLCHPLMYSSRVRESLFSDSLWRMTPLETAFSLCWYSLLHQSRANQRVSEGTGPQRFNLQKWDRPTYSNGLVDVRTLCLLVVRDAQAPPQLCLRRLCEWQGSLWQRPPSWLCDHFYRALVLGSDFCYLNTGQRTIFYPKDI